MNEAQLKGLRQEAATVWGRFAIYVVKNGHKSCKMFGLAKEVADRFAVYYEGAIVEEMP